MNANERKQGGLQAEDVDLSEIISIVWVRKFHNIFAIDHVGIWFELAGFE